MSLSTAIVTIPTPWRTFRRRFVRRWVYAAQLGKASRSFTKYAEQRLQVCWYVSAGGQTIAVAPGPVRFAMQSPENGPDRDRHEQPRTARIIRTFAIVTTETTAEQYEEVLRCHSQQRIAYRQQHASSKRCPIVGVSWYQAVAYYC